VPTALAEGVAAADQQIDEGADLLVVASPPEPVAATAAVALLTDTEPVKLLPRGAAATDPEAWMARAVAVRDLRRRCAPMRDAPVDLMTTLGSAPLAATAALLLRAAARRTPVVLDGSATAAAALLAYELQPRAVRWWTAADLGTEPGHEIALTRLGQRAILALGTDLSDGTAGMLAVLTLQTALQLARTDNPVAENGYS
jgi:nicotinate-nucleotide--dimethylbenzimidazole phosphoribosyltransferase